MNFQRSTTRLNTIRDSNIALTYVRKDYDMDALDEFVQGIKEEDEIHISDAVAIQRNTQLKETGGQKMSQQERKDTIKTILQKQIGIGGERPSGPGGRRVDFKYDEMLQLKKKLNKVLKNKGQYNNLDYYQQELQHAEQLKQQEEQDKKGKLYTRKSEIPMKKLNF